MLGKLAQHRAVATFLWLLIWLAWWDLWDGATGTKWGGEVAKFGWMSGILALFLSSGRLRTLLPPVAKVPRFVVIAAICLLSWAWISTAATRLSLADRAGAGQDIALNTVAAENWILVGKNPYEHRAQLQHVMPPGPNVSIQGDETKLFGLRYSYGFPYYPGMFLSYLPFRLFARDVHSIALGNLILMLVNAALIFLLSRRMVPAGFAIASVLAVLTLPDELFNLAITDWIISTYALAAFLMLSRQRWWMSGAFLGLAQSCKLLPGALLIAVALVWLWKRPGFREVLLGYLATCLVVIGPFVLWSPSAFLSATVLFYRAFHWGGDNTSLWFVLPESARPIFTAVGMVATIALVLWSRRGDWLHAMRMAFASYFVFVMCARMIHLNYLWSILPLGCAAFFIHLAREGEPS